MKFTSRAPAKFAIKEFPVRQLNVSMRLHIRLLSSIYHLPHGSITDMQFNVRDVE